MELGKAQSKSVRVLRALKRNFQSRPASSKVSSGQAVNHIYCTFYCERDSLCFVWQLLNMLNKTVYPSFSLFLMFYLLCVSSCISHIAVNAVDCLDPTCSNNGICVNGECHCKPGWGGLHCELPRAQCPDQCHGHGAFIPDTGLCSCDPNWMGPDCSMGKSCCKACSSGGGCERERQQGRTRPLLQHILCSPRTHG